MAAFALSTNLYSFAQTKADSPFFGWPTATGEAEVIKQLGAGDVIVPKFAANTHYAADDTADEDDIEWQQQYCSAIGVDYAAVVAEYEETVASGEGAVPFLIRVKKSLDDDDRPMGPPWVRVAIETIPLANPLSAKEFLLLRAVPPTLAAQFKGTVSRGRHLQEVPAEVVPAVRDAAAAEDRSPFLRQYSLVEASSAASAAEILAGSDRSLREGDRAFLASAGGLLGVHDVTPSLTLQPAGAPIPKQPDELIELFEEAKSKAVSADQFAPSRVLAGAKELKDLLEGPLPVLPVDDFGRFHDRYVLMASKVTQALEIAARPSVGSGEAEEPDDSEADELAALQGLTIEAVRQTLPPDITLPDAVLAEAVTALRAGKHLLLGGPPGTGKSTLAEALSKAVVGNQYDVVTATADWSTFDTIGGYMPTVDGPLRFEPGVVLRSLQRGRWLTIDELNRADIDKAFGPLFTLLAGTGKDQLGRGILLPFQTADGNSLEIRWAENRASSSSDYVLTPGWRLIGTLNLSDKATLFQLSFAFLRRFAVIDVPLPTRPEYTQLFDGWCSEISEEERQKIVEAAMDLAFGPRQLGPAILRDVATFMVKGLSETASGTPNYADPVEAFVTAIRLFAVPQYEGAEDEDAKVVLDVFANRWPERPASAWQALEDALSSVVLS